MQRKLGDEMKKITGVVIFILVFSLSVAQSLVGTVSRVSDGDTLHLETPTGKYKVRFYGIDAPEISQDYGLESKVFVAERILGERVKVDVVSTDRYGRKVGKIYYGYGYRNYLNRKVVEAGYAWWYQYYAKEDRDLQEAEAHARKYKAGLWRSTDPVAPWEYRRSKKKGSQKGRAASLDRVVYVTKSGKKYHRAGCEYLKSVAGIYTIKEAEARGYTPCRKL